jgi:ribosomal-protein-alanine N-acetyltransferase
MRPIITCFPVTLESKNLILREFHGTDASAVHAYASDAEVVQHQVWGPNTESETKIFIEHSISNQLKTPRTVYEFAIVLKDSGELIGGGGIHPTDPHQTIADMGYTLAKKYWGQGYGTEAAQCMTDFGFQVLKLHRIWATCRPENFASARVLEKCGMIREGYLQKNIWQRDRWVDSLLYAIVKEDQ